MWCKRRSVLGTTAALGVLTVGLTATGGGPDGPKSAEPEPVARRSWDQITRDMTPADTRLEIYKEVRRFLGPDAPDPDADPEGFAASVQPPLWPQPGALSRIMVCRWA